MRTQVYSSAATMSYRRRVRRLGNLWPPAAMWPNEESPGAP